MILWAIWNARNKCIFEDKQLPSALVVFDALALWDAFPLSNTKSKHQQVHHSIEQEKWKAPDLNMYKCNIDGAWKDGQEGIGVLF